MIVAIVAVVEISLVANSLMLLVAPVPVEVSLVVSSLLLLVVFEVVAAVAAV